MIWRLVAASLTRRSRQVALIVVAVTVATATVAALVGFARQARGGLEEDLSAFGPNLMVRPQAGGPEHLAAAEVERIRDVPGVRQAAGVLELGAVAAELLPAELRELLGGRGEGSPRALAAEPSLLELYPHWRLDGWWPEPGEVLLGVALAAGPGVEPAPGAVAGRLATGGALDEAVLLPLAALPGHGVSRVEVRAHGERLRQVAAEIERRVAGAEARPLLAVSESEDRLGRRLTLLLAAVSGVCLLLAVLSVGATATALVEERRREVGLFVALGYTGRRVAAFFTLEMAAAALAGALLGGLLGELAGHHLAGRLLAAGAAAAPVAWQGLAAAALAALGILTASLALALARIQRLDAARVLRGE